MAALSSIPLAGALNNLFFATAKNRAARRPGRLVDACREGGLVLRDARCARSSG